MILYIHVLNLNCWPFPFSTLYFEYQLSKNSIYSINVGHWPGGLVATLWIQLGKVKSTLGRFRLVTSQGYLSLHNYMFLRLWWTLVTSLVCHRAKACRKAEMRVRGWMEQAKVGLTPQILWIWALISNYHILLQPSEPRQTWIATLLYGALVNAPHDWACHLVTASTSVNSQQRAVNLVWKGLV